MADAPRILHLVLVDLKAETADAARDQLIAGWSSLRSFPGVTGLDAVPRSAGGTHDCALFAILPDLRASEEFGTDARHMSFLQRDFIPVLKGFAGADLFVTSEPPQQYRSAFCFLLKAPAEVYDWQIKAAMDALRAESGSIGFSAGVAVNARQRYQAGGLLCFEGAEEAGLFASGERFSRIRRELWQPISTEVALVWGQGGAIEASPAPG